MLRTPLSWPSWVIVTAWVCRWQNRHHVRFSPLSPSTHTAHRILVPTTLAYINPFVWPPQSQAIEAHLSFPIYFRALVPAWPSDDKPSYRAIVHLAKSCTSLSPPLSLSLPFSPLSSSLLSQPSKVHNTMQSKSHRGQGWIAMMKDLTSSPYDWSCWRRAAAVWLFRTGLRFQDAIVVCCSVWMKPRGGIKLMHVTLLPQYGSKLYLVPFFASNSGVWSMEILYLGWENVCVCL